MKVLFSLFLLITASAYSACDDVRGYFFSRILDNQTWPDIHETLQTETAGVQHTVSVESAHYPKHRIFPLEEEGVLTIKHHEREERLVITMRFSDDACDVLQTSMFYTHDLQEACALVTHVAIGTQDLTTQKCGRGCLDLSAMKSSAIFDLHKESEHQEESASSFQCHNFDAYSVSTPLWKRPTMRGIIHGNAHHVDVTQYLFCGCDDDRGHFIRMRVQCDNLREVSFFAGQERYGGSYVHGERAKTQVCVARLIKLGVSHCAEQPLGVTTQPKES